MATSPVNDLLSRLEAVTPAGDGQWKARCPAHEDRNPSLSVTAGGNGTALVKCWAGCETESICTAVGLSLADLFPTDCPSDRPGAASGRPAPAKRERKPDASWPTCNAALRELDRREQRKGRQRVKLWTYHDAGGVPIGVVVRYETADGAKAVIPISRQPDGQWAIKAMPEPRLLYLLPTLADAATVYVCEGEKAADAISGLGLVATTSPGGCKAASKADWSPLAGKQVILLPDADEPGQRYAEEVIRLLSSLTPPPTIKVVRLPGLPAGGDAVEWIESGGTREELLRLVDAADVIEAEPAEVETPEIWPELVPFAESRLPEFPTDALPEVLRDWVRAVSHSLQVPADLPAMLSLAVCSFCISRKVEINGGWFEPTNLYVAVLMPPGSRKSAVFTECLSPLERIESALIESERETVARAQAERRMKEKMLAKLEAKAAGGDQQSRHEAIDLAAELTTERVPVLPRLLSDNATAERLETLLAEQDSRIMSASAEGGVFDVMAGRYSSSGTVSIDIYLKGHAGDNLRTDRIGRESVRIEKPALTLAYSIQPAVIDGLAENQAMSGRGLWARFLWAIPSGNVGYRDIDTEPVPEPIRMTYQKTVEKLFCGAQDGTVLTLSSGAADLFRGWRREAEAMKREGEALEAIVEWGSKLEGATLRIAAVLHSVEYGPKGEVQTETIKAAIEIARYLIPHAEVVLTMASAASKTISDAQYIWRWIVRNGCREFSKSEAQQAGRRRFRRATDIDEPLMELCRRGYIKGAERDRKAGRPSETYVPNPSACAEYTGNSSQRSQKESIQDIQYITREPETIDDMPKVPEWGDV